MLGVIIFCFSGCKETKANILMNYCWCGNGGIRNFKFNLQAIQGIHPILGLQGVPWLRALQGVQLESLRYWKCFKLFYIQYKTDSVVYFHYLCFYFMYRFVLISIFIYFHFIETTYRPCQVDQGCQGLP